MRRTLLAALFLALLSVTGAAPSGDRRLAIRVEGGRRVEVFRAVPLYRGLLHTLTISGRGVDKATRVEAGQGVVVREAGIRRSADSLEVEVVVDAAATPGTSELRLRFPIELAGPEVFPVVVLRNGRVSSLEPRRVEVGRKVTLTFSGTDLGNADVLASSAYRDARVLPGGSETRCQVELVFTKTGPFEVPLYDRAGLPRPGRSLDAAGGYVREPGSLVDVTPGGPR